MSKFFSHFNFQCRSLYHRHVFTLFVWIGACLETPPNSNYSRKQFRSCYGFFIKSEFKMSLLKASMWIWITTVQLQLICFQVNLYQIYKVLKMCLFNKLCQSILNRIWVFRFRPSLNVHPGHISISSRHPLNIPHTQLWLLAWVATYIITS